MVPPSSGFNEESTKEPPCILILFLIAITLKTLCLDDDQSGRKCGQKYKLNNIN